MSKDFKVEFEAGHLKSCIAILHERIEKLETPMKVNSNKAKWKSSANSEFLSQGALEIGFYMIVGTTYVAIPLACILVVAGVI